MLFQCILRWWLGRTAGDLLTSCRASCTAGITPWPAPARSVTIHTLSTFGQTDLCWSRRSPARWGRSRRCGCRARGGGGGWGGSAGRAGRAPPPRPRVSAPRHPPAAGGPATAPWSPGGAGPPHGHHQAALESDKLALVSTS